MMTAAAGIRRPLLKSTAASQCAVVRGLIGKKRVFSLQCQNNSRDLVPLTLMSRLSHTLICDEEGIAAVSRFKMSFCLPSVQWDHSTYQINQWKWFQSFIYFVVLMPAFHVRTGSILGFVFYPNTPIHLVEGNLEITFIFEMETKHNYRVFLPELQPCGQGYFQIMELQLYSGTR